MIKIIPKKQQNVMLNKHQKLSKAGQKHFSFHSQWKVAFSKNDDAIEYDDVIKLLAG